MRKCAVNTKLCEKLRKMKNCAIPHPPHLNIAPDIDYMCDSPQKCPVTYATVVLSFFFKVLNIGIWNLFKWYILTISYYALNQNYEHFLTLFRNWHLSAQNPLRMLRFSWVTLINYLKLTLCLILRHLI